MCNYCICSYCQWFFLPLEEESHKNTTLKTAFFVFINVYLENALILLSFLKLF